MTDSSQVCISGPGADVFSVATQPHSPFTPDHSIQFVVQFAPLTSTTGLVTATVTIISDDDARSSYTFVVQGTSSGGAIYLPIILKNDAP